LGPSQALYVNLIQRGLWLTIQRSILRLPGEIVDVHLRQHILGSRAAAIGQRVRSLNQPVAPVVCPNRFPKAAVAVKNPGANLLAHRIPANNFPAVGLRLVSSLQLKVRTRKFLSPAQLTFVSTV